MTKSRLESEPLIEQVDAQLATIAAERDRIAGELHDDSVQAMTAVSLQLQLLATRTADPDVLALIERARSTTDTAIDRLRHMLFVLHPSTLEEEGLLTTLEVYMESFVEEWAPAVEWTVRGDSGIEVPVGVSALGFRLAREAISNAVRHGSPSTIDVVVACDDHELRIVVTDDGSGFDANARESRPGHLGLAHSRALAAAALGSHEVTSDPDVGTTVTISLPISA